MKRVRFSTLQIFTKRPPPGRRTEPHARRIARDGRGRRPFRSIPRACASRPAMQLDFSGDGLPEPSFENAVHHDAEGFATVPVCGVPLRLRQSEILGGRLWTGGLRLALEIERGEVILWVCSF